MKYSFVSHPGSGSAFSLSALAVTLPCAAAGSASLTGAPYADEPLAGCAIQNYLPVPVLLSLALLYPSTTSPCIQGALVTHLLCRLRAAEPEAENVRSISAAQAPCKDTIGPDCYVK